MLTKSRRRRLPDLRQFESSLLCFGFWQETLAGPELLQLELKFHRTFPLEIRREDQRHHSIENANLVDSEPAHEFPSAVRESDV